MGAASGDFSKSPGQYPQRYQVKQHEEVMGHSGAMAGQDDVSLDGTLGQRRDVNGKLLMSQ